MMHFRAKELNRRSSFPTKEVGKRTLDEWDHERVYIDRPAKNDGDPMSLAEFLLPMKITPLNYTIVNDFIESLTDEEQMFLDDLTAGFNLNEISRRQHLDKSHLTSLRQCLQQKSVDYL